MEVLRFLSVVRYIGDYKSQLPTAIQDYYRRHKKWHIRV